MPFVLLCLKKERRKAVTVSKTEMNEMKAEEFIPTFSVLAKEQGVSLSEEQACLCYEFSVLLLEWNQRVNLTRITDPREMMVKHFLDSLIPACRLPSEGLAADVGTGAGFPGIPLKIFYPRLRMVLLETHRKKVSFLKVVLSRLRLENIWALQGRWETFEKTDHPLVKESYDLVVMRALELQKEHLSDFASKILRPGGIFAWWAGPRVNWREKSASFSDQKKGIVFDRCFNYELPLNEGDRQLLLWKRTNQIQNLE